jgi:N-methylhydantoinase A
MELHVEPAREAVSQHIADPLGLSIEEAAAGVIRVVNANMVRGISVNSTQKGYDLREFSLLAFGGAGPLHAVELAQDLGKTRVIVPPYCAVFSAFGAVASDVRHDYVQTVAWSEAALEAAQTEQVFAGLEARAMDLLVEEKVPEERIRLQRSADIRYEGQSYELTIPLTSSGPLKDGDLRQMIEHFHAHHQKIYAYSDKKESVEVISLRLAALGLVPELRLRSSDQIPSGPPTPKSQRPIHFPGSGFLESYVYEREHLVPGHAMLGPCLIEEKTSTTVIPSGWRARMDPYGNLVVSPHFGEKEADLASMKVDG